MRLFLSLVSVVLIACPSRTLIRTDPSGAKIWMNGHFLGTTPYEHSDTNVAFSSSLLLIRKEGYEDLVVALRRDEELNTAACLLGPCCGVPYLWLFGYKSERLYVLEPLAADPGPPPPEHPPERDPPI